MKTRYGKELEGASASIFGRGLSIVDGTATILRFARASQRNHLTNYE